MSETEASPWDVARRAIDEVLATYLEAIAVEEGDDRPVFLTDWAIVMAGHVENEDGSATAYNRLARDDQPPHITLGLLDYHRESLRESLFRDED